MEIQSQKYLESRILRHNTSKKLTIRHSTLMLWLLFGILTLFVGFRWDVGLDWPSYMKMFGENFGSSTLINRIESANLLIKISLLLNGLEDGRYFLWVMGFLTMFFVFYSIHKYSISPIFSIALFVFLGMYFDLMNGVRQYLAISIAVFSWQFLFNRQVVRYVITIMFAYCFHSSALVMLPVYFICNFKYNKQILVALAVIAIPLSFIITPVVGWVMAMFPQYDVYSTDLTQMTESSNVLSYFRVLFPLLLFVFIYMIYDKLIEDQRSRILTNLALMSIFCTLFFPGVQLMIRVGFYFQMAFIFIIPVICKTLTPRNGKFVKWFSLIYAVLYITITQLSRPVANILPFELDFELANGSLVTVLLICFGSSMLFIYLMKIGLKNK